MDEIRVLHVDDEPDFSELTAAFLERADERFEVETARSAAEGLEVLRARPDRAFDCVVSDYDMNGQSGIEFLRAVRGRRPDLPFVLFTGKGSEEVASDAIRAGATDYLQKETGTEQYELLANRVRNAVTQFRSRRAEQRLAEVADHTDQLICVFDGDWRELHFVNAAYEELWGRSAAALREDPRDLLNGVHPKDRETVREEMDRLASGDPIEIEFRVVGDSRTDADDERWIRLRGEPIRDDRGDVVRITGVGVDVSEERRSRRRRERQRQTLLELATDEAVASGDLDAAVEKITETAAAVLDVPRVNVWLTDAARSPTTAPADNGSGAADDTLVCVDHYERTTGEHESGMRLRTAEHPTYVEALATNRAIAVEDVHGDPRTVELADEYLRRHDIGALLDGTLRSEGEVIGMVCHEHVGGTRAWTDDEIEFVSDVADVVHRAVRNCERAARESDLRRYETIVQSLADAVYTVDDDGRISFVNDRYVELKGAERDALLGTELDQLVDTSVLDRTRSMYDRLDGSDRDVARIEYDFQTLDGESVPAELRFTPLPGADDGVARVGVIRDITDRKRRERELERQNERLNAFASVVSHDLRNPLHVASGSIDVARERHDSDRLDAAADALDRMEALIDDLLALARDGGSIDDSGRVNPEDVIAASWRTVDTGDASLAIDIDSAAYADEGHLRQLLENLFRNAVEHGSTDGRIADSDGVPVTVSVGELNEGAGFFVEDDGSGIPAHEREAVFENGYSTAPAGTGFGLTIAKTVAEAHGWTVRATDGRDGGARFEFVGVEFA
jgi:PAS domain S-box-containing protein